jgi:hypothetical protein
MYGCSETLRSFSPQIPPAARACGQGLRHSEETAGAFAG